MRYDPTRFEQQRQQHAAQPHGDTCPNCGPDRQRLVIESGNLCCWTCDEVVRWRRLSVSELDFYHEEANS